MSRVPLRAGVIVPSNIFVRLFSSNIFRQKSVCRKIASSDTSIFSRQISFRQKKFDESGAPRSGLVQPNSERSSRHRHFLHIVLGLNGLDYVVRPRSLNYGRRNSQPSKTAIFLRQHQVLISAPRYKVLSRESFHSTSLNTKRVKVLSLNTYYGIAENAPRH